jgi:hypothetical protein
VGPPYGTHPLRFVCSLEQRAEAEHVVQHWAIWDVGEKLLLGLIGVFELTTAGAIFFTTGGFSADQQAIAWVIGMVMAADAMGLAGLIALTRPTWQSRTWEQDGQWHPYAAQCPPDLRVAFGGRELPVDAGGRLDPNDEAWLVRELVLRDAPLELRSGTSAVAVRFDPAARCEWAAGRRLPAPDLCQRLSGEPALSTSATLELGALPAAPPSPQPQPPPQSQ